MAVRVKPLVVVEQALGGSARPGAAQAAEKILLALTDAGWRFYHEDEPRQGLAYHPAPSEQRAAQQ